MTTTNRDAALRELRALVSTYLESSDDAARAAELLDALNEHPASATPAPPTTTWAMRRPVSQEQMFGCTLVAIDEVLTRVGRNGKAPRDITMYAMSTLSNAQEYIRRSSYEDKIEWTVADRDANTLRQLINVAKYAIDKAVPR